MAASKLSRSIDRISKSDDDEFDVDTLGNLASRKELRILTDATSRLDDKITAALALRSVLHASQLVKLLELGRASHRLLPCLSALRRRRRTRMSPAVADKVCLVKSLPNDNGQLCFLSDNLTAQSKGCDASKEPTDDCKSLEIYEDYSKLVANWKACKKTTRKFDVQLSWDDSLKNPKPIVVLCHNYMAVALNAKSTTSISLFNTRNFELINEIRLGWSSGKVASYLDYMAAENVLVLRSRLKFIFWHLDSFDVRIINNPFNLPATMNERDFMISGNLIACWDVEQRQRMNVFNVSKSHEPRVLRRDKFDYAILSVEPGSWYNCALIGCLDPRVCYMELRSKDDFSPVRTIELSASTLVDPAHFFYDAAEGVLLDEFIVRSTLGSYKVWSIETGKAVHEFVADNGHFDWFKAERIAFGRLFGLTESGRLYCWSVDSDVVESWRRTSGALTRSFPIKIHVQTKQQRDFGACTFDYFQVAVHRVEARASAKSEIQLSCKIFSFLDDSC